MIKIFFYLYIKNEYYINNITCKMLIGVCGKKGSGKDTISDYIVKNYNFNKYSLADPLKKGCMELFGFTYEQLYTDKKEETDEFWSKTPREVLQFLGTDIFRKYYGDNMWIKVLDKKMDKSKNNIIADIRFINEYHYIKSNNGLMIKVVKTDLTSFDTHISENELNDYDADILIINDSSLEDLYNKIDNAMLNYKINSKL